MSPKGTKTGIWTGGAFSEATATGDVTISISGASGGWTLYGPGGSTTGTGSTTLSDVVAGAYYLIFDAVSGYLTPSPVFDFLEDGETVTLSGTYYEGGGYDPVAMLVAFLLSKTSVTDIVGTSPGIIGPRLEPDISPPVVVASVRGGARHRIITEERRPSLQIDFFSTDSVAARTLYETAADEMLLMNNETVSGNRLVCFTEETEGVDFVDPVKEWPGVRSFFEMFTL